METNVAQSVLKENPRFSEDKCYLFVVKLTSLSRRLINRFMILQLLSRKRSPLSSVLNPYNKKPWRSQIIVLWKTRLLIGSVNVGAESDKKSEGTIERYEVGKLNSNNLRYRKLFGAWFTHYKNRFTPALLKQNIMDSLNWNQTSLRKRTERLFG